MDWIHLVLYRSLGVKNQNSTILCTTELQTQRGFFSYGPTIQVLVESVLWGDTVGSPSSSLSVLVGLIAEETQITGPSVAERSSTEIVCRLSLPLKPPGALLLKKSAISELWMISVTSRKIQATNRTQFPGNPVSSESYKFWGKSMLLVPGGLLSTSCCVN